jgi:hypothetical protein
MLFCTYQYIKNNFKKHLHCTLQTSHNKNQSIISTLTFLQRHPIGCSYFLNVDITWVLHICTCLDVHLDYILNKFTSDACKLVQICKAKHQVHNTKW